MMALYSPPIGGWVFEIERGWTCTQHDEPEYGCESCGAGSCAECEGATWEIVYDAEGWATMTFRSRTSGDALMERMIEAQHDALSNSTLLFEATAKGWIDAPAIEWNEDE